MSVRTRLTAPLFDKLAAGNETGRLLACDPDRFSERALRDTVRRELGWILNTTNLDSAIPLDDYPQVRTSVLNYGVPELTGKAISHRVILGRAREIRQALRAFEPRLDEESLTVEPSGDPERENSITFTIHADISSAVAPVPVRFKTDVENDGGEVTVRD